MKYIISYSVKKGKPNFQWISETIGVPVHYNYQASFFDVTKSITNPWRRKELRKLDGRHPDVIAFVKRCEKTNLFVSTVRNHLLNYGRTVAVIGCSGGKHRSVAAAEITAERARADGHEVTVIHRDLPKAEVEVKNVESQSE